MMKTVIDILEELEATPSRLDKERILNENIDNELLKRVFVASLDPYVVYYVNKVKLPEPKESHVFDDDVIVERFLDGITEVLATRNLTGNMAKDFVDTMMSIHTARQQKWCMRILIKNIRCGVQDSTVNKVWPDLIRSFKVQLANTLQTSHDKNTGIKILDAVWYPVRVEPKLDGLRCIAVKRNGTVTMHTRNGKLVETLGRIKDALENASYDNVVLDGEILADTGDWNTSASVMMSHKDKKDDANINYHVFDAVPFDEWESQRSTMTFKERQDLLGLKILANMQMGVPIKKVIGIDVYNEKELLDFYQQCLANGYEGIMLKDVNVPYYFKRSDAILKMKPVFTVEGCVVGHYSGRSGTSREGGFGGFSVLLSNGKVTRVGGGFNDAMRVEIKKNGPETYIGRIAEVEGQPDPQTNDGLTVAGAVRFPVFIRFRDISDVDPVVLEAYEKFTNSSQSL